MRKGFHDHTPKISLTVLGTLCFVTLMMCQTRFKITKEISDEIYPPVLRSKDCWFLYTVGNPDRFKCVLKAFIVITSPVLSLISTALLLLGKAESNPYFFIPWLFLTIKGLLLIQTDNIITILTDMSDRENYIFGFQMEDAKWFLFYTTVFMIDLVEAFSFYEVLDLFLVLWNHHPGYNVESTTLKAVRKEIDEIMESLSKCSLSSLSRLSLGSTGDSEDADCNPAQVLSKVKCLLKENENALDPLENLLKYPSPLKTENFNSAVKLPLGTITSSESEHSSKTENTDPNEQPSKQSLQNAEKYEISNKEKIPKLVESFKTPMVSA